MIVLVQQPNVVVGFGLFNFAILGLPSALIGSKLVGVAIGELNFFQPELSWRRNRTFNKVVEMSLKIVFKKAVSILSISVSLRKFLERGIGSFAKQDSCISL